MWSGRLVFIVHFRSLTEGKVMRENIEFIIYLHSKVCVYNIFI